MIFTAPLWLAGLAAVALAAAWAIIRPSRQLVVTPSLELWQRALESLRASSTRRIRRISPAWWCLLAGATAAIFALANPVLTTETPSRRVAIVVLSSAEFDSLTPLKAAAQKLLNRLDSDDRVKLILASDRDSGQEYITLAQAARELETLKLIPVPREQITFVNLPADVQHTYIIGSPQSIAAPNQTQIQLPTSLPKVTFDRASVEQTQTGELLIFAAVRNNSDREITAFLTADDKAKSKPVKIPAGKLKKIVLRKSADKSGALTLSLVDEQTKDTLQKAHFTRRNPVKLSAAIIGKDSPLLRRYIAADARLELIADPQSADVIFANQTDLPTKLASKPAVLIAPPTPLKGWVQTAPIANTLARDLNIAASDWITRCLNFDTIAIRKITPCKMGDLPAGKLLVSTGEQAVIYRTSPEASAFKIPKRVYLNFSIEPANTNLSLSPQFVVLMSNITTWFEETHAMGKPVWGYFTPTEFYPKRGTDGDFGGGLKSESKADELADDYNWPGYVNRVWRGEAISAINIFGLKPATPATPVETQIAQAPLPAVQHYQHTAQLRGIFIIVAAGLWLAGWWFSLKS